VLIKRVVTQPDQQQLEANIRGPRYIVASAGAQWKIVRGGPHRLELYPTKTQAVCAAIELAEHDPGAEVLVRHEDGYVLTEWVQGQEAPEKAARPNTILGQPGDPGGRRAR